MNNYKKEAELQAGQRNISINPYTISQDSKILPLFTNLRFNFTTNLEPKSNCMIYLFCITKHNTHTHTKNTIAFIRNEIQ